MMVFAESCLETRPSNFVCLPHLMMVYAEFRVNAFVFLCMSPPPPLSHGGGLGTTLSKCCRKRAIQEGAAVPHSKEAKQ